jgi:Flp pilus assembly protein TadD
VNRKRTGTRTPSARPRLLATVSGLLAASALASLFSFDCAFADPDPDALSPAKPLERVAAEETKAASESALAEARRLADAKKFGEAAGVLRAQLAADPKDADARSLLARVLAWDRHYDQSIAEYRTLLAAHPDDAFDRAGYARTLAWSGRSGASLREFRRAVRADSTDLEARVGYARALSWAGDLPGASMEYRRILRANPAYGDAWLGLATTARWRGAPAASDRFLERAVRDHADAEGLEQEYRAVGDALAPSIGAGVTTAHERQYVAASPDFAIESTGPYAQARATVARAATITARASRLAQFERRLGPPVAGTTLNYDLDMTVLRADAVYTRSYPFQLAAGIESRAIEAGSPNVIDPLRGDDRFFGWNARAWMFAGRWTPSVSARREYVPIKADAPTAEVRAGRQTAIAGDLAFQWNARGTLSAGAEHGSYSDENDRSTLHAGAAYRLRLARPGLTADYGLSFTDFDSSSASYFTPLKSTRHAAGLALSGYSEKASLDWGARYQFAAVLSSNFENIYTSTWSGYLNLTAGGAVPLGLEASYSRDNNAYETWFVGASGAVRW